MEKAIKALWHGIKALFTALVDWFGTLFGMKNDNSKYSRMLRRIVGTAFAIVVACWGVTELALFGQNLYWNLRNVFHSNSHSDDAYFSEQLSDDIAYYESDYGNHGYLQNSNGKKILKDIFWIAKPIEGDSLVCYSDGELRGYFHLRDGRPVVPPTYKHAWVFSGGLAAVEKDGRINFIGTTGQVVIDKPFRYIKHTDYVFHNGLCAVHDGSGKHMGLIDPNGDWVIDPIYDLIVPEETFWHLTVDGKEALLSFDLDTIMPLDNASLWINDSLIIATFADHTQSLYSSQGKLITSSMINCVQQLMYDTREVFYPSNKENDDNLVYDEDIFSDDDPSVRKAVATCYQYSAECGWHGLMSPDGHIVTPPSYARIEAVAKDLYLCESPYGYGVILNSKGQRVN